MGKKKKPRKAKKASTQRAVDDPGVPYHETRYRNPDVLEHLGPVIDAQWRVPPELARRLVDAGRDVPDPVNGQLLVDTGASKTCIALSAAIELGLKPIRREKTHGVAGEDELDVYRAEIRMEFHQPRKTEVFVVGATRDVLGVPDLENVFPARSMETRRRGRLIGILGREFLKHGLFFYGGSEGRIQLWVDPDTL
jgi:predicted aspartyl protease